MRVEVVQAVQCSAVPVCSAQWFAGSCWCDAAVFSVEEKSNASSSLGDTDFN